MKVYLYQIEKKNRRKNLPYKKGFHNLSHSDKKKKGKNIDKDRITFFPFKQNQIREFTKTKSNLQNITILITNQKYCILFPLKQN